MKLLYQGHASFRLTTDEHKVIYIDPFIGDGYDVPADIILCTHEHYDHNKVELVTKKPTTKIIHYYDVLQNGVYKTLDIDGVEIKAVPAYNSHHDRNETVGYVIHCDGVTVYHAGDTDVIPEMANLTDEHIDYALLPIDGFYTMGPKDVEKAQSMIRAKNIIVMHTKVGAIFDLEKAKQVTLPGVLIIKPGDEIILKHE